MALEQIVNNLAATTLNGAINNSVTSIAVTSGAVFPSVGNFRILIDSEIMLVTARSTNTLTVTRAQEGTSAASHSTLAPVSGVLTAAAIDKILAEYSVADTVANIPTAAKAGRLFMPTDGLLVGRDNGTSFNKYFGPLFKFTPPVLGDYTWLNQGSTTATTVASGVDIACPTNSGLQLRILHKTRPTPPYKITAFAIMNSVGISPMSWGLGVYDPTGGRIITHHNMVYTTGNFTEVVKWNSATSFNAVMSSQTLGTAGQRMNWLQLEHDGTTIYHRVSNNGFDWITITSAGKTAFCANDPTKVLIMIRNDTNIIAHSLKWLHWKEE